MKPSDRIQGSSSRVYVCSVGSRSTSMFQGDDMSLCELEIMPR